MPVAKPALRDASHLYEVFLQEPKEEVRLKPGETFTARARRPHLVTNAGETPVSFLVLQGVGEYDYVPLV